MPSEGEVALELTGRGHAPPERALTAATNVLRTRIDGFLLQLETLRSDRDRLLTQLAASELKTAAALARVLELETLQVVQARALEQAERSEASLAALRNEFDRQRLAISQLETERNELRERLSAGGRTGAGRAKGSHDGKPVPRVEARAEAPQRLRSKKTLARD